MIYLLGLAMLALIAYALGRRDGHRAGIRLGVEKMRARYLAAIAAVEAAGDE